MPKPLQAIDEPALIAFYCRQCEKVVSAKPKDKNNRYTFLCPDCGHQCAYGTARSMINILRIKENSEDAKRLLELQQEKLGKGTVEGGETDSKE